MECILVFGSTHRALKAELALKEAGVPLRLLPAPKSLAEYCALVISVAEGDLDRARARLKEKDAAEKAVYRKETSGEYVKV